MFWLKQWSEVKDSTTWDTLLLGNGASIALAPCFEYHSLYIKARELGFLSHSVSIFEKLDTANFEYALRACWHAVQVNEALGESSAGTKARTAYNEIRATLINTINKVHCERSTVVNKLLKAAQFASTFGKVITLNYDLTFYWAFMLFNDEHGKWFKDVFINQRFERDWSYLTKAYPPAKGASLVFYPHGNLCLAHDIYGNEMKLASDHTADLLSSISATWATDRYMPLFVSEGSTEQKLSAIRSSPYLNSVYESVLSDLNNQSVVMYGISFNDNDQHIISAIAKKAPKRIAISVYPGVSEKDQRQFCETTAKRIRTAMPSTAIDFFRSDSPGCWCNP